jgi:hypothetical protein
MRYLYGSEMRDWPVPPLRWGPEVQPEVDPVSMDTWDMDDCGEE